MTVDDYIDALPEDRRIALRSVREVINSRLPAGYEEGTVYGMIAWFVPWTRLAETYNGEPLCLAGLASTKGYMTLHLMSVYGDPALRKWFEAAYKKSGKKLDMGKACLRFKTLDALALDVIGDAISRVSLDKYVDRYERSRSKSAKPKAKPAAKQPNQAIKQPAKKPAKKPAKRPAKRR